MSNTGSTDLDEATEENISRQDRVRPVEQRIQKRCKIPLIGFVVLLIIIIAAGGIFLGLRGVESTGSHKTPPRTSLTQNKQEGLDTEGSYVESNPECSIESKLGTIKLSEKLTLSSTIYKEVTLIEKPSFDLQNGTTHPSLIEWSRKNVKSGDKIHYNMSDYLLMTMLGKFVGPKGQVTMLVSDQTTKLANKNSVMNDIHPVMRFEKSTQPYSIKKDTNVIIGCDITKLQMCLKIKNARVILKLHATQDTNILIQRVWNQARFTYIEDNVGHSCEFPTLQKIDNSSKIKSGYYIVQMSSREQPKSKEEQKVIGERRSNVWYVESKPNCSVKGTYSSTPIDDNYKFVQTAFQNVQLKLKKDDSFERGASEPQLIQWARNNVVSGQTVLYQGQNILVGVMLGKYVGQNGKLIVNYPEQLQQAFMANAILNDIEKVVTLQRVEKGETLEEHFDLVITQNEQTARNCYQSDKCRALVRYNGDQSVSQFVQEASKSGEVKQISSVENASVCSSMKVSNFENKLTSGHYYCIKSSSKTAEGNHENGAEKPAQVDAEESVSKESVSKESVSKEPISKEPISKEPISKEPISKESISKESVSKEPISKEPISKEPISKESVSKESVSKEPISKEPISKEPISKESVSKESVSKEPISKEPISKESVSKESISKESISKGPNARAQGQEKDLIVERIDKSWYINGGGECLENQLANQKGPHKIDQSYAMHRTIYRDVYIILQGEQKLEAGSQDSPLIQWSRKAVKPGQTIAYEGHNQVLIVMLGKFLGPTGHLNIYQKPQHHQLTKRNLVMNNIEAICQTITESQQPDYQNSDIIILNNPVKASHVLGNKQNLHGSYLVFNTQNYAGEALRQIKAKTIEPSQRLCQPPKMNEWSHESIATQKYLVVELKPESPQKKQGN